MKTESLRSTSHHGRRPLDRRFKPRLQALLETLRLNVIYERGQGDYLYHRDEEGREVAVLDLVGGYGSLLLGHAHPVLVAEAQRLLASGRPMHAQGSLRDLAARLSDELSRRAQGDFCVRFGNSGTEAVEAAMKHAMLETGGRTFITLERAFHGKTLGALQLTANPEYRAPFEIAGLTVRRIEANNLAQLEAAFATTTDLAGFIFEPILGEGGVRPLQMAFIQRAAQLCAERDVPLIADECQTGMGRTGTFLACEGLGVQPDYVLLAKSLGGGLAKISAVLIRRSRYCEAFDLKHSSTFAEDDYSCGLALKTLELVDSTLLTACRTKGDRLLSGLRRLAAQYPGVIADVRGQGLMLGVEFRRPTRSPSFLLRFLAAVDDLALVITGYLFNVHQLRVAPTLSDPLTIRLEPSALLEEPEILHFLAAMDDVCARLASNDALGMTRYLCWGKIDDDARTEITRLDGKFMVYDEARWTERHRTIPATKVAWLCHLMDADDLVSLEPAFAALPMADREQFLARLVPRMAPVVLSAVDVRSATGEVIRLYPILLPFTSAWAKRKLDDRALSVPQALVQQGIQVAQKLGCHLFSLGQYTSIVTLNGTRVAPGGLGVTTGNSYAVALAIQAIERAQREIGREPADSTLVVVGAGGNIGRTCAEILAPRYQRTVLVGSDKPGSAHRLENFGRSIPRSVVSTALADVRQGHVVVAALNAVDAPLHAGCFAPGAIVCDLSVPASVAVGTDLLRPDLLLIKGGIVSLPGGEDLEILDFPLPRGQTYGCMAEALLLGLAGECAALHTGAISAEQVVHVAALARRHGFSLADYKRNGVLGAQPTEEMHVSAH